MGLKSIIVDLLNNYETKRIFRIRRKRISVVNYLSKIIILFVIGGIICFQYFIFGQLRRIAVISSTLTTKVKGLGYTYNAVGSEFLNNNDNETVFDTADYVIPPDENDAIFIMTNFLTTQQKRDICDENPYTTPDAVCENDSDCLNKDFTRWNGKPTGLCITSTRNATVKVCQVKAWCPVEDDTNAINNVVQNVNNYTIFIKSTVEFKEFDKIERNIQPYMTNDYISTCSRRNDTLCPIFQVGDLLEQAEPNENQRYQMLVKGGVIQLTITWKCDYSPHISGPCLPEYKISRFDGPPQLGFNFRYADKFLINQTTYRNLNKVYGIRIIMTTTGQGLKPDAIGIIVAFLAFFTLFSFSILVTDFYILNCYATTEVRNKLKDILVENDPNNKHPGSFDKF